MYRTNGVIILSTTVQLPATHWKVEGGERDIQLVHVNEANSCLAYSNGREWTTSGDFLKHPILVWVCAEQRIKK
jgi:hypothetical protein